MAEIEIPKPKINTESSLIRSSKSSLNEVNTRKKPEPKPLKGGVVKREPTFFEKLKRSFVKEDITDIRDYVVFDIIIPGIRQGFFNMIVGTAGQIFGVSVPSSVFSQNRGYSQANVRLTPHERRYRDYNSISQSQQNGYSVTRDSTQYDRFSVSDWKFEYKEDADSVLEQLIDICDYEGWVSVSHFFNLVDPDGSRSGRNPYTNNNFGWYNLDDVPGPRLVQDADGSGYVLDLPRARPR